MPVTVNIPHKRILILCEGYTEYYYAVALKNTLSRELQRSLQIEPDIHHPNDPKSLVQEAQRRKRIAKKEKNAFSHIWLFFDNDNFSSLQEAFQIIENERFCFAYSSICIEHWFLLHFENCGRSFSNGAEAKRYLEKFWPDYHKTKIKHYEVLEDKLQMAMKRAISMRRQSDTSIPICQKNPYITVDKLIEFVRNVSESSTDTE